MQIVNPPRLLWPPAPPGPGHEPGTIDVYAYRLDAGPDEIAAGAFLLTEAERARAERFHTRTLHDRFVMSRATLRRILAARTGDNPRRLRFDYGPHGKPALRQDTAALRARATGLEFNLSHTQGLGLLALGTGLPSLGVDVEQIERPVELEPLARRCFEGEEYEDFRTLEGPERTLGFFLGWTRKEAFMKATGEGLARPLDTFEVELRPTEPPRFLRLPEPESPEAWLLEHLAPATGFVGALAVRSSGSPVRVRTWSWRHGLS
jgi:4'-phosphopantetheinyl transferase